MIIIDSVLNLNLLNRLLKKQLTHGMLMKKQGMIINPILRKEKIILVNLAFHIIERKTENSI